MSQPPVNQRPAGPPPAAPRPGPSHSPRSGAHRPRRPIWHDIVPALVVLVAVVALVLGFFQLKDSVLGGTSTGGTSSADVPVDEGGTAPTAPVSTSPTGKATASASPSATSTGSAAPVINHAVRVKVFNATNRSGLAKGAADKLSSAGWKAASAGNQQGYGGSTRVFYPKPSLRATAKAIAKDLGGYPVAQSTAYGSTGVVVILASDYQSG